MCDTQNNSPLPHCYSKQARMLLCEASDAGEAFFTFLEKRKKEEKRVREGKELSILNRL